MQEPDLSEFRRNSVQVCFVKRVLRTLSKEDAEKLRAALKTEDIASSEIARWLENKIGERVLFQRIAAHRAKRCACE